MEIGTRSRDGVVILDLNGRLTIGDGDAALREAVLEQLEAGRKQLLLDLARCRRVDSAGLGELIRTRTTCAREGAAVKLLHLDLKVYKLMTMAQLIGVFEIFDDEDKAVASFDEGLHPTHTD